MKVSSSQKPTEKAPENPRLAAVRQIMNMAQILRRRGSPEEAIEAAEWEKKLTERLRELEGAQSALAA